MPEDIRARSRCFLRGPGRRMLKLRSSGGGSSAGRASRSQCEGREFDPPPLHHFFSKALALKAFFFCRRTGTSRSSNPVIRDVVDDRLWAPKLSGAAAASGRFVQAGRSVDVAAHSASLLLEAIRWRDLFCSGAHGRGAVHDNNLVPRMRRATPSEDVNRIFRQLGT